MGDHLQVPGTKFEEYDPHMTIYTWQTYTDQSIEPADIIQNALRNITYLTKRGEFFLESGANETDADSVEVLTSFKKYMNRSIRNESYMAGRRMRAEGRTIRKYLAAAEHAEDFRDGILNREEAKRRLLRFGKTALSILDPDAESSWPELSKQLPKAINPDLTILDIYYYIKVWLIIRDSSVPAEKIEVIFLKLKDMPPIIMREFLLDAAPYFDELDSDQELCELVENWLNILDDPSIPNLSWISRIVILDSLYNKPPSFSSNRIRQIAEDKSLDYDTIVQEVLENHIHETR